MSEKIVSFKIQIEFQKVLESENRKVMLGCKEVASGEYGEELPFSVLQSENKNVITIVANGYYNHVLLSDIIKQVLRVDLTVKSDQLVENKESGHE